MRLIYENVAAANKATVGNVLARLAAGTLADGLGPITPLFKIGIEQSMGGCLLIIQQGQHRTFDAVGILGYSGSHTVLWMPPGVPNPGSAYIPRGSDALITLDASTVSDTTPAMAADESGLPGTTPGFHYDDEPADVVADDMIEFPTRQGKELPWASWTTPPCAVTMMSPGAVAPEAASITVPVFVGVGERDVCPDPMGEPKAYQRSTDVTVYVCPRMSHMHNFASTREQLWARLHGWATAVASMTRPSS